MKMEKQDANLCLSGKPKPFSSKRESSVTSPDKRPKETIFSKFTKPNNGSKSKADKVMKDRPKTASVKNNSVARQQSSFPIRVTLSRPSSANVNQEQKPRSRFRFPGLKTSPSIDSAVGSQMSSTDDDNKSSSDNDHDDSDHSTDDDEESSEDSGIIKVRVVSRSTGHESDQEQCTSSAHSSPILVKEFNRTPDNEHERLDYEEEVEENIEVEQFDHSEDEESKAEPPPTKYSMSSQQDLDKEVLDAQDDVDTIVSKDIVLMEVGPEEKSEIIPNIKAAAEDVTEHALTVDDIEYHEDICNEEVDKSGPSIIGQVEQVEADIDAEKLYNPASYEEPAGQNGSLLQLMTSNENRKPAECYKDLIQSTINKLEQEEEVKEITEGPVTEISKN